MEDISVILNSGKRTAPDRIGTIGNCNRLENLHRMSGGIRSRDLEGQSLAGVLFSVEGSRGGKRLIRSCTAVCSDHFACGVDDLDLDIGNSEIVAEGKSGKREGIGAIGLNCGKNAVHNRSRVILDRDLAGRIGNDLVAIDVFGGNRVGEVLQRVVRQTVHECAVVAPDKFELVAVGAEINRDAVLFHSEEAGDSGIDREQIAVGTLCLGRFDGQDLFRGAVDIQGDLAAVVHENRVISIEIRIESEIQSRSVDRDCRSVRGTGCENIGTDFVVNVVRDRDRSDLADCRTENTTFLNRDASDIGNETIDIPFHDRKFRTSISDQSSADTTAINRNYSIRNIAEVNCSDGRIVLQDQISSVQSRIRIEFSNRGILRKCNRRASGNASGDIGDQDLADSDIVQSKSNTAIQSRRRSDVLAVDESGVLDRVVEISGNCGGGSGNGTVDIEESCGIVGSDRQSIDACQIDIADKCLRCSRCLHFQNLDILEVLGVRLKSLLIHGTVFCSVGIRGDLIDRRLNGTVGIDAVEVRFAVFDNRNGFIGVCGIQDHLVGGNSGLGHIDHVAYRRDLLLIGKSDSHFLAAVRHFQEVRLEVCSLRQAVHIGVARRDVVHLDFDPVSNLDRVFGIVIGGEAVNRALNGEHEFQRIGGACDRRKRNSAACLDIQSRRFDRSLLGDPEIACCRDGQLVLKHQILFIDDIESVDRGRCLEDHCGIVRDVDHIDRHVRVGDRDHRIRTADVDLRSGFKGVVIVNGDAGIEIQFSTGLEVQQNRRIVAEVDQRVAVDSNRSAVDVCRSVEFQLGRIVQRDHRIVQCSGSGELDPGAGLRGKRAAFDRERLLEFQCRFAIHSNRSAGNKSIRRREDHGGVVESVNRSGNRSGIAGEEDCGVVRVNLARHGGIGSGKRDLRACIGIDQAGIGDIRECSVEVHGRIGCCGNGSGEQSARMIGIGAVGIEVHDGIRARNIEVGRRNCRNAVEVHRSGCHLDRIAGIHQFGSRCGDSRGGGIENHLVAVEDEFVEIGYAVFAEGNSLSGCRIRHFKRCDIVRIRGSHADRSVRISQAALEHDLFEISDIGSVKRIDVRSADILEVQSTRCRSTSRCHAGRDVFDLILTGEGSAFDGEKRIFIDISGCNDSAVERTIHELVAVGTEGTEVDVSGHSSRLDQVILIAEHGVALDRSRRIGTDDCNGLSAFQHGIGTFFRADGPGQAADIDSAVHRQKRIRILEIVDRNGIRIRRARGNRTDLVDVSCGHFAERGNIRHRSGSIRNQDISGSGNSSADRSGDIVQNNIRIAAGRCHGSRNSGTGKDVLNGNAFHRFHGGNCADNCRIRLTADIGNCNGGASFDRTNCAVYIFDHNRLIGCRDIAGLFQIGDCNTVLRNDITIGRQRVALQIFSGSDTASSGDHISDKKVGTGFQTSRFHGSGHQVMSRRNFIVCINISAVVAVRLFHADFDIAGNSGDISGSDNRIDSFIGTSDMIRNLDRFRNDIDSGSGNESGLDRTVHCGDIVVHIFAVEVRLNGLGLQIAGGGNDFGGRSNSSGGAIAFDISDASGCHARTVDGTIHIQRIGNIQSAVFCIHIAGGRNAAGGGNAHRGFHILSDDASSFHFRSGNNILTLGKNITGFESAGNGFNPTGGLDHSSGAVACNIADACGRNAIALDIAIDLQVATDLQRSAQCRDIAGRSNRSGCRNAFLGLYVAGSDISSFHFRGGNNILPFGIDIASFESADCGFHFAGRGNISGGSIACDIADACGRNSVSADIAIDFQIPCHIHGTGGSGNTARCGNGSGCRNACCGVHILSCDIAGFQFRSGDDILAFGIDIASFESADCGFHFTGRSDISGGSIARDISDGLSSHTGAGDIAIRLQIAGDFHGTFARHDIACRDQISGGGFNRCRRNICSADRTGFDIRSGSYITSCGNSIFHINPSGNCGDGRCSGNTLCNNIRTSRNSLVRIRIRVNLNIGICRVDRTILRFDRTGRDRSTADVDICTGRDLVADIRNNRCRNGTFHSDNRFGLNDLTITSVTGDALDVDILLRLDRTGGTGLDISSRCCNGACFGRNIRAVSSLNRVDRRSGQIAIGINRAGFRTDRAISGN